MRSREYIAARGGRFPSRKRRRKLHHALERFEKAYLEWLRNPVSIEPMPTHFGLTQSQVSTIMGHCRGQVQREINRRLPHHD